MASKSLLDRLSAPLDRLDALLDRVCDPLFEGIDQNAACAGVSEAPYRWWIVASSTMTHLVVTDAERTIVIAPVVWNMFIGMSLDLLLEKAHARAARIPGPYSAATLA